MRPKFPMCMAVCVAWTSAASAQGWRNADAAELTRLVDAVVDSSMKAEHIPGAAVVVVQGGRVVLSKGYGLANIDRNVKVDNAVTLFRIGSISKVLTSRALVDLAERRRIPLTDPVDRYVGSDVIANRFSEPVRLWHLMTHTAGFDQIDTGRTKFDETARLGLAPFFRTQLRVIRPPGVAASYDTYGIALEGMLIERLSGAHYADYMRKSVFEPLGMSRTFVEAPAALRKDLAVGYAWLNGEFKAQPYEWYESTPASSIDATPDDMGRYMRAVLADSTHNRKVQFSHAPGLASFSYGLWEDVVNGERIVHHGGNMLEYEAEMWLVPARQSGVFVIYNRDGEAGGPRTALRQTLTRRMMDLWSPPRAPMRAEQAVAIDVHRFAGSYGTASYCHLCPEGVGPVYNYYIVDAVAPGTLVVRGTRDTLNAIDSLTFVVSRDASRKVAFKLDARGEVAYLLQRNEARERLGDRLLTEALGPGWESRPPETLMARVYRDTRTFAKCADAYETLAKQLSNARSYYYAGECALSAGDAARASTMLAEAWRMQQWPGPTSYLAGIASAVSGNADAAFEWLTRSKDLGSLTAQRLQDPRLATLKSDPRWEALSK